MTGWEDPGRIIMNHNQTAVRPLPLIRIPNHNQTIIMIGEPGLATNHNQTLVRR
jgi:hypothetical protein